MIVAIHQPNYLPYTGFFNKAIQSDVFVFLDHVQYEKRGWQNRNRIRKKDGWFWLTVPVLTKNKFSQKINEVRIDNNKNWRTKHWKALQRNYQKAPFFGNYEEFFKALYSRHWEKLIDLNSTLLLYIFKELEISVDVKRSSELDVYVNKTDMIIEICQQVKADTYLSGIGGANYLEEGKFKEKHIKLVYQNFHCPIYKQMFEPFIPDLSVIDLLFNLGHKKARTAILRKTLFT